MMACDHYGKVDFHEILLYSIVNFESKLVTTQGSPYVNF